MTQVSVLHKRRAHRDDAAVHAAIAKMVEVSKTDGNMIVPMLEACRAEATLGEICNALRDEWGVYTDPGRF